MPVVRVPCGNGPVLVANFHGLWDAAEKATSLCDLTYREQFVLRLMSTKTFFKLLLCGDFNLLPGTQALALLASGGLRNLVLECGVTYTRTHLHRSFDTGAALFADYVLMSPALELVQFDVLPDVVSDPAALRVHFEWGHGLGHTTDLGAVHATAAAVATRSRKCKAPLPSLPTRRSSRLCTTLFA